MKNKVLLSMLLAILTYGSAWAQSLPNNSFENWVSVTDTLSVTFAGTPVNDTTTSQVPQNWTTSDEITNGHVFHNKVLVTQNTTDFHVGASSIQLKSDTMSAHISIANLNFVSPGFAVCGSFAIDFSAFTNAVASGSFNPGLLPGAGIPVSTRYQKIGGYMKYSPVGGDSAFVVAILRNGPDVVATATYTRTSTDNAFTYFEAPFIYTSCLVPDTLVYTISSGDPYVISHALSGATGLHVGTTLLVDSVFVGAGLPGFGIAEPIADSAHTNVNTAVSIPVTANDLSCAGSGSAYTVTAGTAPHHGTISVSGDTIVYTPTAGYAGYDTFTYVESVGGGPDSSATVVVKVSGWAAGINDVTEAKTSIYPNPANTKLHINTANPSITELRVVDMLGKVLSTENFTSEATVDVSGFTNGLYIIQFSGRDGKVISSSRFTVVK